MSTGESDMEVFKEFLESSTIHGLYYVATAKVKSWSSTTFKGFNVYIGRL